MSALLAPAHSSASTPSPRPVRPVSAVFQAAPAFATSKSVTSAPSLSRKHSTSSSSSSSSSSSASLRTPVGSPDLCTSSKFPPALRFQLGLTGLRPVTPSAARSHLSADSSSSSHSRKHSPTALLHPARAPSVEDDIQAIPARLRSSPLILCASSPFYRLSHPSEQRAVTSPAISTPYSGGSRPSSQSRPYSVEHDRACLLASTEDELKRVLDSMLFSPPSTSTSPPTSRRPSTPTVGAVATAGRGSSS